MFSMKYELYEITLSWSTVDTIDVYLKEHRSYRLSNALWIGLWAYESFELRYNEKPVALSLMWNEKFNFRND